MQKATVGARQVVDRLRSGLRDQGPRIATFRRAAGGVAGSLAQRTASIRSGRRQASLRKARRRAGAPRSLSRFGWVSLRPRLGRLLGSERILPVGMALLVLMSAIYSFSPLAGRAAVGGADGNGSGPRIAIGGELASRGAVLSDEQPLGETSDAVGPLTGGTDRDVSAERGHFLADGTLLKPVAVDTSVADGRTLIVSYTVKQGDTLSGIAAQFNINLTTIWWANSLTSKDSLQIGQVLTVPTINGLVIQVAEGDTIDALAAKYGIDPGEIISVNGLEDPNLVIGQTLIMPGAKGDAMPAPTPAPVRTATRTTTTSTTTTTTTSRTTYSGGAFAWPVVGGNNYISQYFHYGHYAIDIAADYGTPVVAAAGGTVLFSGWKNNGGGYQVWISHGSNLYTTYNHMSALTVGSGQSVGRGQQVGRVGMTGDATGPHLHFEVWIGPIWDGGYRVNPLNYY